MLTVIKLLCSVIRMLLDLIVWFFAGNLRGPPLAAGQMSPLFTLNGLTVVGIICTVIGMHLVVCRAA